MTLEVYSQVYTLNCIQSSTSMAGIPRIQKALPGFAYICYAIVYQLRRRFVVQLCNRRAADYVRCIDSLPIYQQLRADLEASLYANLVAILYGVQGATGSATVYFDFNLLFTLLISKI